MTSRVLKEIEAILESCQDITKVHCAEPTKAIAAETDDVAAYIHQVSKAAELVRPGAFIESYDFHGFYTIILNVDCSLDKYKVYDIVDEVSRSLLKDTEIWGSLVNRDIVSCEYDNAEFYPKRSAIIGLEVTYRIACNN